MERPRLRTAAAALAAGLCACSGLNARIKAHQAEFDAWPAEVQEAVREGQAEVGFTPLQAEIALGSPDRKYARKIGGRAQEVWAYGDGATVVGMGVGMAWGGSTAYGSGAGPDGGRPHDDRVRLIFERGRIVSVERRKK